MKRSALKSDPEKTRAFNDRRRESSARSLEQSARAAAKKNPPKRQSFTPASSPQKAKVRDATCPVTGLDRYETTIDAAHLWKRQHGGCDDPLCVIGLARAAHRAFDDGELDLLPYLRPSGDERRFLPELLHMLDHADGDLLGVLHRLTGERFVPEASLPASRRGGS